MANWKESGKKILDSTGYVAPMPTASTPSSTKTPTTSKTTTGSWKDSGKKILDSTGYVAPKKRLYELNTEAKKEESSTNDTPTKKDGFGSWIGKQAMVGIGQFNKGISATLDFILPTEFLGKYDYISKLNEYNDAQLAYFTADAQKSSASRGKGWKTAGDVVTGTVAAAPNAILAFMSAGTSLATTGATALSTATPTATSTASMLAQSVKTMMKNPTYWTSAMRTLGTDYEEAKERGANDLVASATAIITTALNAGIEVGGGIETLPNELLQGGKGLKNAVFNWAKSSLEEGREEVLQGITTNAMAKLMYDHNAPLISTKDENAVFNPVNAAKEFGMGVAVGGLLGGAQSTVATGINTAQYIKTGKFFNDDEIVSAMIVTGLESPENTESYKLATKYQQKLNKKDKLSNYEIGKLYFANVEQIGLEEKSAKENATEETQTETPVVNEQPTDVKSEPVVTDTQPVSSNDTTTERNTFTEELDDIASVEMPTVSVGDAFVDSSTNNIIKVVGRDDNATTIEINTPSGKKETKKLPNKTADTLVVDDKYTKVETPTEVVAENANTTPTENPSVTVGDVFVNNKTGDTYTVAGRDAENTTLSVKNNNGTQTIAIPNSLADDSLYDVDTFTKSQGENVDTETHEVEVAEETTTSGETVQSDTVDLADGETLSLKHTKNIYSLFKGAKNIVIGTDIISDGFVAISLTDKNIEGVKKVAKDAIIQNNSNFTLSKLYANDNDIVIQGNPKIITITGGQGYVFKIGEEFYVCNQKYIDAFNNGKNIIKANKNTPKPWTVHDEKGNFVALFMGVRKPATFNDNTFNELQSVSDVLEAENQKKAEKAKVGLNQNELRLFKKGLRCMYGEINSQKYITNSHIILAVNESEANAIIKEYETYNNYNKATEIDFSKHWSNYTSFPEFGTVSEIKTFEADKNIVACVVNDIGFTFDKNYVNLLKKRGNNLKVLSDGTLNKTILASFDENGNCIGLALPVRCDRETIDGLTMFTGKGLPNVETQTETTKAESVTKPAKTEAVEETKPDTKPTEEVLNSQPESDKIEEKPDLKVGDVIEHNGKRWKVESTGFNMSFENLDKNDKEASFSYIGGMESFKNTHDYKVVTENTSSETQTVVAENETTEPDTKSETVPDKTVSKNEGTKQLADYVSDKLSKGEKISSLELSKKATEFFGGTMANNVFSVKDAYDAMELGVNQHILSMKDVSADKMLELLELLPTQTKRTEEQVKFQQFSTPPSIAYLANYTANVNANDIMLEPSAGIGGIAVFAKKDGAKVYVNELDSRRLEVLKNMPFDGFYNENAEQLDNILGGEIEPTVIVMNPPFSSSAERNMKKTKIGASHIEQALKILAPNGRLVAIVGKGMADGEPAFRNWWTDIKSQYNVRANIGINGKNYNKYGTNFDIQMLVIDKNGPTEQPTVTGYVDTLQELQDKLGGIRDERPAIDYSSNEQRTPTETRTEVDAKGKSADSGNRTVSDTSSVTDKGKSKDISRDSGKLDTQDIQPVDTDSGKSTINETENADVLANENERVGNRQSDGLVGEENSNGVDNSDSGQSDIQTRRDEPRKRIKRKELTDSIFEQYQTQQLRVKNSQPHPAKVSESAAMSAIEPPAINYKPTIPQDIIDKGVVSDVQLEAISYAGQSHSQVLPNGTTRGFFLGDGTGIGKGRTIAGMMLDNYNQGRKKSVWVTLNPSLVNDAKRDVKALFGNSDLVMQFEGGEKANKMFDKDEAILVVSYSTLSRGYDNTDSNFEKIVKWLGKDFDGLIVFDEAHKMGNATATKGTRGLKKASQTGLAGIALQEALPKARVVYSSATGATEVENLRYAERLGLWGEGTPFIKGDDFVSKVKAGGLAAMELIARDMKAMGVYLSRNISYDDVQYDKITHNLTAQQTKIYNELASSWQIVLQNINKALETTNQDKDGHARGRALGAFWSSQQRFFNQILTSMQVPSVISDIEKQLADGKSCVIQLVSTNEAAQNQEFERLKSEDLELDEFDLTPRQVLMSLIQNSFPVQQFEEYRDDKGNVRSRPVVDSKGVPVVNRDAVRQRDELLTKLGSIKVPSSPIDMIINHFGTDLVAENTGRTRRVIQKDGKTTTEKIGNKKDADVDAFQNGNKRIIIFSKAGGTGKSYHADKSAKNQQQRVHYLLEAGWQADNAVQGFGRSHRSNQAIAPIFKLVTTNLKGQMRFISTIAKRLDQLGAMTKGQRQAGGQGMFSASDNLENSFAADVLAGFYKDLISNRVDGIDDGYALLEKLGLKNKIIDEYNRIIPTAPELREVNKFLNRILSLECNEQNTVFDGYSQRLQDATEKALAEGTLDKGLENYKADRITLNEVQDIREDEKSGAKTKYYNLTTEHKIKPVKFEHIPTGSKSFVGFYQNKNTGNVRAVMQTSSTTDQYGNVTQNYKLVGQVKNEYIPQHRLYGNWVEVQSDEAQKLWNEELAKLPEYRKENLHLISGVVLPVWDKLPTENVRIYRVLTSDGEMLIGRVVSEDMIDETLRRLGSSRKREKIATKDLITNIKNGDKVYLENDWILVSRKVSGEDRIELLGPSYEHHDMLMGKGVFAERIQYRTRYFVPADTNTEKIIDDILKISPMMRVENEKYSIESEELSDEARTDLLSGNSEWGNNASTQKQAKRVSDFKQKLKGKTKAERRSFAKELLEQGQTEEITDGLHKYNLVKPTAYNDDMLSIVEEAKTMGKEVGFFIGHGKRKFDSQGDLKIDAIVQNDNKILLRYDGKFAPQTLIKHEDVHIEWDNPEMQKAKDIILNNLSEAEKKKILAEDRYKQYMSLYKGDEDAVWQEFVADVFAGMNDYAPDYIDLVVDYWYEGKVVDRYNPAEYIKSIDAGGNTSVLNDIGLGDEYKDISNTFDFSNEIEETKDLIAVHNLNIDQLNDAITRGQFAMPSIAVTNKGHTDFGEVSVVFNKDTIDPSLNTDNKLYGSDAWTPTQTRLKKNPVFDNNAVSKTLEDVKNTIGKGYSQLFDMSRSEFKEAIANADGSIFDALSDNIGMQTAYALKNRLISKIPKTESGTIDIDLLREQLDSKFDKDTEWRKYKRWLGEISDSVITLYDTASNEDILNNMKAQPDSAKRFKLGENGELTVPAKEYNSIDEYRQNKDRLSENAASETKVVGLDFVKWAKEVQQSTDISLRGVVNTINSAFNNRYNASDIISTFAENGIKLTRADANSLQTLYKRAVELPTAYFEAKPQRAVGLDEVAMVVLPDTTSTEVKSVLDKNNMPYIEYDSKNKQARIDALNSIEDVKFSLSIEDDIAELTPERKKEIFEQFERDRVGVDKPTQKQIWGERAEWIAHNMTRVFPEIPERGERGTFFAEFRKMMIQWKALPQTSMFMAQDKLNQMTKDLTPDEFKTFSELVYFLDLQEEAQIQKERGFEEILLPNEITPHEVDQIVGIINQEATDNVKKALAKRQQIWDNMKEQYVTLNQYIGFDTADKFKRKNYYHHQVIEYMNQGGKGVAKGKDIEIKAGRGWLKERQGSTLAINTDFLAVEYKAMLQMQYDIYVANMLGKIKDQYDIKPQLEKQAFNNNKKLLNDIIKEEATDEKGNVMLDSKGRPDSETYRTQQWFNQKIMFGFSGLVDLANADLLPTFNGQYGNIIRTLKSNKLNAPGLYNYVGELASMELSEDATDEEVQARISARTVLKYTSQKKAWVKEILAGDYQTWETLANDMKDTHSIHQPRRGNYFYTKTTVDEDAFNKAFNDMIMGLVAGENGVDTTAEMKKLFTQYSETIRLMGAAYEQWVIPNEIETTMNKVANPKQAGVVSQGSRAILSAWKGWATSVNPLRTVKFGIRNMIGDFDSVIAGNPKVLVYSKQAVDEIYQAMKHKKYSVDFMEWVERGGYSSLIFANEMDTEMQDKIFSHLKNKEGLNIFKIPAKIFEGYYNGVETAHNFREGILRYSAYLYFKNDIIKNGGNVKDNVASNRYIVQGLQSVEDKAYQLSKDLLGAYDEVATMGQALRRHAVPFYSFTETNLKRYYRLFENIVMSDDNIPKKAGKLLLKTLMINALTLIMVAWNRLVMKDDDDELPPSVRNIPHITLGKIGDDVYAFRQLGSFSELLEWVGFEDYKWTEEDKTAALDKAVGMVTPVAKTPVELLTGLNFYPSITQPRSIRDKVEHLFSTLGVDDVYRVVSGKPSKGVKDILKGAVTYTYDYKESAYYEILDIKRKYQGDEEGTIYKPDEKSNALYYMKTAIRYKDKKAALKYLDEYFEKGGTAKGVTQSISMLNPMYGYTGKDTIEKGKEFVKSLSDDEKDKLKIAQKYYENDLMLPENVSSMLRQKGITDEQAKNLLTKYINSKCK